jgi:thiol-disulfide isomerase/thioredoxin
MNKNFKEIQTFGGFWKFGLKTSEASERNIIGLNFSTNLYIGMTTQVKNQEEFSKIIKETKDKLIVVDFFTSWCGPCKGFLFLF